MKSLLLFGTLLAGSLMPVQTILNTRLGKQTGGPLMGVLMSFLIGTIILFIINCFINGSALATLRPNKIAPWFLWTGGLLGALFLSYTTWVNQQQGIALTFILVICGQIIMSLLIDNYGLIGAVVKPVSRTQLIGIVLILAGIFLVRK